MSNYKGVPYISDGELLKITPEQLNDLKTLYESVNAHNKQVRHELANKYKSLVLLANEIWGNTSKEYRYLSKAGAPWCPYRIEFEELTRRIEDARKKVLLAEQTKNANSAAIKVRDEAIAFLLERGKKFGQDFTSESAFYDAREVKFEELKAAATKDEKWHSFNGQNCDGPCKGWDGLSRRCECGNRRVDWTSEGDFSDMYIYGEAY